MVLSIYEVFEIHNEKLTLWLNFQFLIKFFKGIWMRANFSFAKGQSWFHHETRRNLRSKPGFLKLSFYILSLYPFDAEVTQCAVWVALEFYSWWKLIGFVPEIENLYDTCAKKWGKWGPKFSLKGFSRPYFCLSWFGDKPFILSHLLATCTTTFRNHSRK